MDPFDEFEFKPLTDGLGFHKKSVSLKEGLKKSGVVDEELNGVPTTMPRDLLEEIPQAPTKRHSFEDVLSALEKTPLQRQASVPSDLQFTEPLPREKEKKQAMDFEIPTAPVQSPFPIPEAYKVPQAPAVNKGAPRAIKKNPAPSELASVGTRRGAADSPQRRLMPATISLASAFLDLIIVSATALVFLVVLLTVTKVDLNVVLANLDRDPMTQVSLGVLFIAVMQMYVVIARSFFGRTLGEWTFDLQVGQDEEQQRESYPLKVALRSLLNIVTGIVLLPLVSALIGRDVAGQISGVKLYRQRV
ncbi:MAG TPA: RDD family protein [Bdellovibrionales bacterium]|nr:RDD family protein [Bdellovibrionales bacterium]